MPDTASLHTTITHSMPADFNQAMYLKELPDSLDFTITAITPSIPSTSGWSAEYKHVDHGHTGIMVNDVM